MTQSPAAILTYHSIDDSGSVLSTSPQLFAAQMGALRDLGVKVVSLSQLCARLAEGSSIERQVAITFDDGFQDVRRFALPVLRRHGFPATVFLVTDYCGGANSWPTQPAGMLRRSLLTWGEVEEMCGLGVSFGSHSRTHPNLTLLSPREAEDELVTAKLRIEDATARPVEAVAYPYGAVDDRILGMAARHFRFGCTTRLGFVRPGVDPLALERIDMYYLRHESLLKRLFSPPVVAYLGARRQLRELRALGGRR